MKTLQEIKLDNLKGNEYVMVSAFNNNGCIHLEPDHYTFTEMLDIFLSEDYTEEDLAHAINQLDITVGNYLSLETNLKINNTDEDELYPMMVIRIK